MAERVESVPLQMVGLRRLLLAWMNTSCPKVLQGGRPIQVGCLRGVGGELMYTGKQRQPTLLVDMGGQKDL